MEKEKPPDIPEGDDHSKTDRHEPNTVLPVSDGSAHNNNNNSVDLDESVLTQRIQTEVVVTPTPGEITILKRRSPETPTTGEPKDYRKLYHEMKRRVEKLLENNASKLKTTTAELEQLKESYATIQSENVGLKEVIQTLSKENDGLKSAHKMEVKLTRRNGDEVIRIKSKSKKVSQEGLKCEYSGCDLNDEDALIKCTACGKWICDSCSDARIGKLKPIMNNCATIYFVCNTCVSSSGDMSVCGNENNSHDKDPSHDDNVTQSSLVTSMKSLFQEHVSQLGTTIESMIEKKLNEKIPNITGNVSSTSTDQSESYASRVLQVPSEVRKVIMEAKNDDKVEESEQERRSTNFIIHGAKEFGDDINSMKKIDDEYIGSILKQLGVEHKPASVVRIGNPEKSNARPLKVTMKSKADQQIVMSRLSRLKNTEEEFGKISITEDYTQTEREMIKSWSKKAEEKSATDETHVYKVRGDPKNGLRLIRVKRRE